MGLDVHDLPARKEQGRRFSLLPATPTSRAAGSSEAGSSEARRQCCPASPPPNGGGPTPSWRRRTSSRSTPARLKRSFLAEGQFRDLADVNRQLEAWVLEEAGNRIHGTTRERPLTRFAEVEQHELQALPEGLRAL